MRENISVQPDTAVVQNSFSFLFRLNFEKSFLMFFSIDMDVGWAVRAGGREEVVCKKEKQPRFPNLFPQCCWSPTKPT